MKNLSPEIVELIQFEIKYSMYYVEFPDDVPNGIWKDGAGELHYMSDMGLDHLKASIRMVERDIKRLGQSDRPEEVIKVLSPKATSVLARLKTEFSKKAQL
jgi:hypothetical protein